MSIIEDVEKPIPYRVRVMDHVPVDDDGTLYDDADSVYSSDSSASDDFQPLREFRMRPVFRLPRADGQKPAYEAWSIRMPLDTLGYTETRRVLGIKVGTKHDLLEVEAVPEQASQSELMAMHQRALSQFQAQKRRRNWASRVFRGQGKSYEQSLDARCRKLPLEMQERISDLIKDKQAASSSPFRTRTWTVAFMEERMRYRFANTTMDKAPKHHKLRFWKNKDGDAAELLEYFVIIQGSETSVSEDGVKGFSRFTPFGNPWESFDAAESRRKMDEYRLRQVAIRAKRYDYRRPARRSHRHAPRPCRDRSPESDSSDDDPPRYRRPVLRHRYTAPMPGAPIPPMVPMAPPAPAPPAVSRYVAEAWERQPLNPPRPRSPSPYRPRPAPRPWVTYESDDPWGPHERTWDAVPPYPNGPTFAPYTPYAPQHFGVARPVDEPHYPNPFRPLPCPACHGISKCSHYGSGAVCYRPIEWKGSVATHPPCFLCIEASQFCPTSLNFFGPPPPPPPEEIPSINSDPGLSNGGTTPPPGRPYVLATVGDYFDDGTCVPTEVESGDDRSDSGTIIEDDDEDDVDEERGGRNLSQHRRSV